MILRHGWLHAALARTAAIPAIPAVLAVSAAWAAWMALAVPAGAAWKAGPPALGAGVIRFHDEDLRDLYALPPQAMLSIQTRGLPHFSPTLAVGISWAAQDEEQGYLAASETNMLFLPVMLQIPWEGRLAGGWTLRLGPQLSWVGLREQWSAAVEGAGLEAEGSASGTWLGAGVMGEIWKGLAGIGRIGLSADWNWASADRATARGNEERETSMKGGWSGLRLCWSPAVP